MREVFHVEHSVLICRNISLVLRWLAHGYAVKARQLKLRVGVLLFDYPLCQHFAQRGAVFEAVTGSASHNPDVFRIRMPVYDQVMVGAVLILTDSGFDQRRVFHGGKSECDVIANGLQSFFVCRPFSRGGIEVWSSGIVGDLESAAVAGWDPVDETIAMVGPDWQLRL